MDESGSVYVGCSGFQGGLEKFARSTSGEGLVAEWKFGEGIKSYAVRGLALARTGNILATVKSETEEGVQVFSPDGRLLSSWGAAAKAMASSAPPPESCVIVPATSMWSRRPGTDSGGAIAFRDSIRPGYSS